jgi:hypothetical protein
VPAKLPVVAWTLTSELPYRLYCVRTDRSLSVYNVPLQQTMLTHCATFADITALAPFVYEVSGRHPPPLATDVKSEDVPASKSTDSVTVTALAVQDHLLFVCHTPKKKKTPSPSLLAILSLML